MDHALKLVTDFYGDKKACRSRQPLIKHINEGRKLLTCLRVNQCTLDAFTLHPLFQDDGHIKKSYNMFCDELGPRTMCLLMEYRKTANSYLPSHDRRVPDLSPLKEVNTMLIADKIQNYKDLVLYNGGIENYNKLALYFITWFIALGVNENMFFRYANVMNFSEIDRVERSFFRTPFQGGKTFRD